MTTVGISQSVLVQARQSAQLMKVSLEMYINFKFNKENILIIQIYIYIYN